MNRISIFLGAIFLAAILAARRCSSSTSARSP
jgi:hypothetical protein